MSSTSSNVVDEEYLRKQVMIGQFVNVVGCTSEQAMQMLQSAQWNFDVCLYRVIVCTIKNVFLR